MGAISGSLINDLAGQLLAAAALQQHLHIGRRGDIHRAVLSAIDLRRADDLAGLEQRLLLEISEAPLKQLARLLRALLGGARAIDRDDQTAAVLHGGPHDAESRKSSILPVFSPSAPMLMVSSGLRFC